MRIAHLSDPHFGTTDADVTIALKELLTALKPDLAVITGDITQRARRSQFKEARDFIKSLQPLETLAVPGNHDIALFNIFSRLFYPYQSFTRHLSQEINPFYEKDGTAIAMLNTTHPRHHVDGEMKISELRRQLSKFHSAHLFRILAFHHPMDCPTLSDEKNLVLNAQTIADVAAEFRVDLLLGGHIHNPITRLSTARYPRVTRPFIVSVAGTCLSYRTRPPCSNAFTLIETPIDVKDYCILSRFEYLETRQFKVTQSLKFRQIYGIWTQENSSSLSTLDGN